MSPVVLAVFAQDGITPLPSLLHEERRIRDIFQDIDKVKVEALSCANFDDIYKRIATEQLRDRIAVFHYGGHADGRMLNLDSGDVAIAESLGLLLAGLPRLQLVFLNGCKTEGLLEAIRAKGVQVPVIATSGLLNDDLASRFADYFYYSFYFLSTIDESFKSAEGRVLSAFNTLKHRFSRGIGFERDQPDYACYQLSYVTETSLQQRLLQMEDIDTPSPGEMSYVPNRLLMQKLADSILEGQPEGSKGELDRLRNSRDNFSIRKDNQSFGQMVSDILYLLPSPLSVQLRNLKASGNNWPDRGIDLLTNQVLTYNVLIQLLTFTMLSCFWNELLLSPGLTITPKQWEVFRNYMAADETSGQEINYLLLLITIREIFEDNNLKPFIAEYQDIRRIFEREEDFHDLHLYMQGLTSFLKEGRTPVNIRWLCMNTEQKLSKIMACLGFIIRYRLATIKDIQVLKSRLKVPSYYIRRIILEGHEDIPDDSKLNTSYTDSQSVILAMEQDQNPFARFLTLSPFIIDENALKNVGLSKLYFFSHTKGDSNVYRQFQDPDRMLEVKRQGSFAFIRDKTPEEVEQINLRMTDVWEELESFKNLIHSK